MGFKNNDNEKWAAPRAVDGAAADAVASGLGVTNATARLLCRRGFDTPEAARAFIRMEAGALHDPFLLPDMEAAAARIGTAIREHQKIVIYGDYDADGVTSVSVLYLYLSGLGADVAYYIPKRSEGYGMSCEAVEALAKDGAELIITVDTGTTANVEAEAARALGVDIVVTDHHECIDVLPDAVAVVNPQRQDSAYPFCGLAGVGVTYKLVCALETNRRGGDLQAATLDISERFADLVAIGTVADVMPVLDENRLIVSYGLRRMEKTPRPGLRALIEASTSAEAGGKPKKVRYTAGFISFTLAPRINAAGRMGDASLAAELFLSDNDADAAELAERLCEVNRERQRYENDVASKVFAEVEASHDFENDPVIVAADRDWPGGIIGIVASRVTEKYGRPSILITFEGDGKLGKGSGRSVRGLNLAEALGECSDCLVKYGGHELAAGLTIEADKLETFRRRINEFARRSLGEAGGGADEAAADDVLLPREITMTLADELRLLEPFGVGNPTPLFLTEDVRVLGAVGVGGGRHTRLTLDVEGAAISAMCFSVPPEEVPVTVGDGADLLYNLETNEFRGERSVQMIVRAVRKHEDGAEEQIRDIRGDDRIYMEMRAGRPGGEYYKYVPARVDMAELYRSVRCAVRAGRCVLTVPELSVLSGGLDCVTVRLAIDIFSELDILRVSETPPGVYTFGFPPTGKKVDLESSAILSMLKRQYSERRR